MATTVAREVFTEEDLLKVQGRAELVDGNIILLSPAGGQHGYVVTRLMVRLGAYIEARKLGGLLVDSSTGFRLPAGNVRSPDVGYMTAGRAPNPLPEGFIVGAPDLAIEVLSPNDRQREVLGKVGELLDAGTAMVWVIDPKQRRATVYSGNGAYRTDVLDGEGVVPGFLCPLVEILP